jgi:hypothetical protein
MSAPESTVDATQTLVLQEEGHKIDSARHGRVVNNHSRAETKATQLEDGKALIPDLFVSWVAQRPRVNPFYEEVASESLLWMKECVRR